MRDDGAARRDPGGEGGEATPVRAIGPRLGVLAAAALFSTGGAVIKAIDLSGWQVASFRSGIAAVALLLMMPDSRRRVGARDLLVALAYAGTMVLFVLANKLTTSASSIFLQSASPLYILLLGPWLLHERIRRRDLGFMVALAVGLACIFVGLDPVSQTAPDPLRGNICAVLSGVLWAVTVIGFRFLGKSGSGAAAAVWGNVFAFLLCLPMALPVGQIGGADAGLLAYLGIFQIGLAYVFLTRALTHVPALEASLLLLLEPVLNPIWSWLAHGERPSAWSLAGGVLILLATTVKTWADARRPA
ncbi:MAG TPA: DMT family transporter [Thermoanaerobaculia bacterium]|nr:DMT family transporter [Thermoanaerobaculia bacterium]